MLHYFITCLASTFLDLLLNNFPSALSFSVLFDLPPVSPCLFASYHPGLTSQLHSFSSVLHLLSTLWLLPSLQLNCSVYYTYLRLDFANHVSRRAKLGQFKNFLLLAKDTITRFTFTPAVCWLFLERCCLQIQKLATQISIPASKASNPSQITIFKSWVSQIQLWVFKIEFAWWARKLSSYFCGTRRLYQDII